MLIFYKATIESVLRYGIVSWFRNLFVQTKTQIYNLIIRQVKLFAFQVEQYEQDMRRQTRSINSDHTHVLYTEYQLLRHNMNPITTSTTFPHQYSCLSEAVQWPKVTSDCIYMCMCVNVCERTGRGSV